MVNRFSRRHFLSKSISAASSVSLISASTGLPAFAKQHQIPKLNLSSLKGEFQGKLTTPQDPDFNQIVLGKLWNELRPKRIPQLIAQVKDENDISTIIRYAKANKLKVSIRGGGHNWCSLSNRNSGILIDLANLNKVISIDQSAHKAIVQPILSNREVQAALKPYNLAFPTGHCPPVKISGYLLSGGMSWNQGAWGPGVGSVEAIDLVTANGDLITANKDQNQDYFWAARGAGPGFFAVAVRYHLKLYTLPKSIASNLYYYPYEEMESVASWLGPLAKKLSNKVELSFGIATAPPEIAVKDPSSHGKVCTVSATVFANNEDEVHAALSPLESCPVIDKCLSKSIEQATDFEGLFDGSGVLWPPGMRSYVDALFYDCNLVDVIRPLKEHFLKCPSHRSLIMLSVFTGENIPSPPTDAAFSMKGKLYGGPWTMWDKPEEDKENKLWHDKCVQLLLPNVKGHYVAETEIVGHPEYAQSSYKKANWERLVELRKKYDPNGIFFDFNQGLAETS